jgi:hypothetical protein
MSILVRVHNSHPKQPDNRFQIFEEGSTFRGKLKRIARSITEHYYNLHGEQDITQGQAEYAEAVGAKAKNLLDSGRYLQGEKDEQVCPCFIFHHTCIPDTQQSGSH